MGERRWRGAGTARERSPDEVIDRRALEIMERWRCNWVEAWARALAEQPGLDEQGDVDRDERTPSRQRIGHAGRVTLSAQIGRAMPARPGTLAPGRTTLAAALPAAVMRSAERAEIDPKAAELVTRARHGGAPLDDALRSQLEVMLGARLDGVRIHTGADADIAARALGARAFAVGDDVFFRDGAYAPHQRDGQRLIAHEVAHTVQARGATTSARDATTVSQPDDAPEREADAFADEFILGLHGVAPRRSTGELVPAEGKPADGHAVAARPPVHLTTATTAAIHRAGTAAAPAGTQPEKGANENKQIGTWDSFTAVRSTTTIGLFNTEAEAMAAANTNGAVILEKGRYAAYRITTDAWFQSFTWDNCKVLHSTDLALAISTVRVDAPWLAVTTADGIVLRPGMYNADKIHQVMTPERMLKPGESPFGGFDKILGPTQQLSDEKLIEAFTAAMKKGAVGVLAQSEIEVQKKRDQFQHKKTGTDELKLIRTTAKRLAELDEQISRAASQAMGPLSAHAQDVDTAEKAFKREEARQRKEKLEQERQVVLNDYPMLTRQNPQEIQNATDDEIGKRLGDDTLQILKDITETRNNLMTGDLEVWGIQSLIDSTIAGCGIADPERRKKIQDHAKVLNRWNTIKTVTRTVFSIGLGLLATFATGGLALVAAAGALGLSTYDAMKTTKEYGVDSAAANTHLDPQMSIAFKDLDGAWIGVAVAWVGVGLDIGTVASALKGVKSITEVGQAAKQLAKGSEALLAKLRMAAGIIKEGEVVTETTRGVLALKVGASVEIRQGLGTEIHVLYDVEKESGRVVVKGVVCGEQALAKDLLEHAGTVKLLTRYEGATGKLRELWERMLSIAGKQGGDALKNPFPPGTQAFESWLEVKKLPKIIESRMRSLEKGTGFMTKEAEEGLRREITILEDDLARHKSNVDALAMEKGAGFVAKSEEATKAARAAGYPFPGPPQIPADHLKYYYYRRDGAGFELCTMQDAPAGVKRFTLQGQGPSAKLIEGTPSAAQKGKLLVEGWSADRKTAFEALQKLEEEAGVHRVVPLQGVGTSEKAIGDAFSGTQKAEMIGIYKRAWKAKNPALTDAAAEQLAKTTVDKVMQKQVTLVQGTEQLRLFDYAGKAKGAGAGTPIGELHHDIPLYLGGDHQMLTDIGKVKNADGTVVDLHDQLHGLINQASFKDGGTLAPTDLAKKIPTTPGAAVLKTDGSIDFYKFSGDKLVKVE